MLPCPQCGYDNELGRIFCHRCGQKLDLDAIKPPSRGGKPLRPKNKISVAQWIRRVVELLLLGAILYMVFLMVQVAPAPPLPSSSEAAAAEQKWRAVEKLVSGRTAGSVEISAAEAQAYFGALPMPKSDSRWGLVPDRVWVRLAADSVELNMLATLRLGGALERKLWLTYSGVPTTTQQGQFLFEVRGGTVGGLNWPVGLVNFLGWHREAFAKVFQPLVIERQVLGQVTRFDVRVDRVVLHYQPR